MGAGVYEGSICKTQYFPPFFFARTSSASGEYPGAMIPSDTSREIMRAVARSQGAERAMKSPKEDMRSAPEKKVIRSNELIWKSRTHLEHGHMQKQEE